MTKEEKNYLAIFEIVFLIYSADFSSAQLVMAIHSVVAEILQEVW